MWQLIKVQQTNFNFSKFTKFWWKIKNLTQLRGMENSRQMSPKYRNGRTASKRTTHVNYTADDEKGTHQQYSGLCTKIYPPTKKRTREKRAKMRPVRTGTLQPAECRYRQIISLGKPAAQYYGGNVSADPLCLEALLRTI